MGLGVIILAAGQGTRMKSAMPKVLHRLSGKPLLGHVIDCARTLSPDEIVVVYGHGGDAVREDCSVIAERPLVITVDEVGSYTIMCTPGEEKALAVGFAFSEGLISCIDDVRLLAHCEDAPGALRMRVADPAGAPFGRNLIVTSSCGVCGSLTVEELLAALAPVEDSLRVPVEMLLDLVKKMRSRQTLFSETGGAHAAAVFSLDAGIIAFAEDIGRHNALDKAVGRCLLERRSSRGCAADRAAAAYS